MVSAKDCEEIVKYRQIAENIKYACMFSGGKDSGLAITKAINKAQVVLLIHILENNNSLYHDQEKRVIEAQAHALGLPLIYMPYKWWRNWDAAIQLLNECKAVYGVQGIIFGDIKLKYIFLGDIPLCEKSRCEACLPIGGMPYDALMDEIEKYRIKSIITKINHPLIHSEFLGKVYDRDVYNHFRQLDIDPFGEDDEFHTTLVDSAAFVDAFQYHLVSEEENKLKLVLD